MPVSELYRRQVALLIRTIPFVAGETCFALKGGTAINLFVRDMPRLSVDIDLTFLPVAERTESLREIDAAMRRIAKRLDSGIPGSHTTIVVLERESCVSKLIVGAEGVQVKVEVTPVMRGCVYEPVHRAVSGRVESDFGFAEMQVVSFADLFAGKIVAALDRQHPRDLFDVRDLLANEGTGDELRKAFIVYLISHNRPMVEVLAPRHRDIAEEFARGFEGLSEFPVTLDELLHAREDLLRIMVANMPIDHRRRLLSIKGGEPDWGVLGLPGVDRLPAVRWRIENLSRMDQKKRLAALARLEEILDASH